MMKSFLPERSRQERIVGALSAVAKETGRSLAQVALAWLRYRDIPVIPIIGARKLVQVEDNLASLNLELSEAQVKALNEASEVELGFPHEFYKRDMVRALVYGGMADRILG
jgi:aryl-alcohol dehydrogenase-like predicted oxidoreductase